MGRYRKEVAALNKLYGGSTKNVAVSVPNQVKPEGSSVSLSSALFGRIGEVKIESLDSTKKFCLAWYKDGIYEQRITPVGKFVRLKTKFDTPYLDKTGEEETGFELSLPKMPIGMLYSIAEFFRDIMKTIKSEVMVQVWWDLEKEEYFLYVPVQKVLGASIDFDGSQELQSDMNKSRVMDIHSHVKMGAFFSGTDSSDEISTRMFGVIGQLADEVNGSFSSVWRAGVAGVFTPLTIAQIWDETDTDMTNWVVSKTEYTKVTEKVRAIYVPPAYNARSHIPGKVAPGRYYYGGGIPVNPHTDFNSFGNFNSFDFDDDYQLDQAYLAGAKKPQESLYVVKDQQLNDDYEEQKEQLEAMFQMHDSNTLGSTDTTDFISGYTDFISGLDCYNPEILIEKWICRIVESSTLSPTDLTVILERILLEVKNNVV